MQKQQALDKFKASKKKALRCMRSVKIYELSLTYYTEAFEALIAQGDAIVAKGHFNGLVGITQALDAKIESANAAIKEEFE